jgi:putative redox protein
MDATAVWKSGLSFTATGSASGLSIPLGSGADTSGGENGLRPTELALISLAGCTGMDVISILQKKRQEVSGFEVRVHGDRSEEHPKVFTRILVEYVVRGPRIDRAAVERAVELSETKYCSVMAMLRKAAPIEKKITIEETATS